MRDPIDFGALGRLARRRPYRAVVFDDARDLVSCAHCWSQILGGNVRTDPPEPWDPSTESWVEYRARG